MKFWKSNSYDIVRLFVIQCGMSIFGSVLTLAINIAMEEFLLPISIFSACFYLVIVYSVMWEIGSKDRIRVDAGRAPMQKLRGAVLMLSAQIPNFLISLLMIVGGAVFLGGASVLGSRIFSIGYFPGIFFGSIYVGMIETAVAALKGMPSEYLTVGLAYLLTSVPAIAVSAVAYWMGMMNRRLIPVKSAGNKQRK